MNAPAALRPYDADLLRWYPLKEHAVQRELVNDMVRFKVVTAGRRSGKTERVKRLMVREAMQVSGQYFAAAPTRDQAKRILLIMQHAVKEDFSRELEQAQHLHAKIQNMRQLYKLL